MNDLKLLIQSVGPWPMNTYAVVDEGTGECYLIDPGADPAAVLALAGESRVLAILLTHGHPDHTGALAEVRRATGAPVYLHPADALAFDLEYDRPLKDGLELPFGTDGQHGLRAVHTPGHTPGSTCFDLGDGRVVAGDAIFAGGPGRTWSPDDFSVTMHTMQEIVFAWPDETVFYPGHGPSGKIGEERPAFERFVRSGWPDDLHGDVTWAP